MSKNEKSTKRNNYIANISIKSSPIIFILLIIILYFKNENFKQISDYIIKDINLNEWIKTIKDFLELSIGIYVAVISILATGRTKITESLSQKNSDVSLIVTTAAGFLESIISIILITFVDFCPNIIIMVTFIIIILSFYQIISFFIALFIMFKITVETAYKDAQDEKNNYDRLINILNKIEYNTKNRS